MDLEVRGAINVVEACAQTDGLEKIVFTSSLTAAIWRENISSQKDVDERCWSNQEFCKKMKVWELFFPFLPLKFFDPPFSYFNEFYLIPF